jgi:aryl-alcohol dehydrogenase-like predicted oxidoreductase
MKYNKLPGTSLLISELSLGTMMFGGQTSQADSLKILDEAFHAGINLWDTANMYTDGESERIVGKAMKGRRDDIILATKVFHPMGEKRNDRGLSRRAILSALEASLRRLDTDYIDLYYLHAPDNDTGIEETMQTMDTLVKSGKIRYVGISNYAAWQIADILALCDKRGYVPPIITQNVYNLITRGVETELIPFIQAHGLGMTAYNPIAGGLLTGKHQAGKPAEDTRFGSNQIYYNRYWSDENFAAVDKLAHIAKQAGISLLELSMKWCLSRPGVVTVITGVSKLPQLSQNIAAIQGEALGEDTQKACDEVWRGLAGTRFAYNR